VDASEGKQMLERVHWSTLLGKGPKESKAESERAEQVAWPSNVDELNDPEEEHHLDKKVSD
jgi:hypothetical protein